MQIQNRFYFYIIYLCVLLFTHSCKKYENPVPYTPVNVVIINIESDPRYSQLQFEGQSAWVQRPADCLGYNCNGIILYRYKQEYDYDDFIAYDATCTHEADSCSMIIDESFPDLLECPCCGSVFDMRYGYMLKGPAKYPLRELQCTYTNGDLRIE